MLTKRIIPCLDVCDGKVVKGIQFKSHQIVGEIMPLATRYADAGADELIFYDITASCDDRSLSTKWVNDVARILTIPFTVSGGIRSLDAAKALLNAGADKLSINSPALENPQWIRTLSQRFGKQCIVVGIDSQWMIDDYYVYQYTGREATRQKTVKKTRDWVLEVQRLGAGEIVLNCMQKDGMREGFDIKQLKTMNSLIDIPMIASGGAGCIEDFIQVFQQTHVSGALAASVFHKEHLSIQCVKQALRDNQILVRPL